MVDTNDLPVTANAEISEWTKKLWEIKPQELEAGIRYRTN